jgi:hypothetical protein
MIFSQVADIDIEPRLGRTGHDRHGARDEDEIYATGSLETGRRVSKLRTRVPNEVREGSRQEQTVADSKLKKRAGAIMDDAPPLADQVGRASPGLKRGKTPGGTSDLTPNIRVRIGKHQHVERQGHVFHESTACLIPPLRGSLSTHAPRGVQGDHEQMNPWALQHHNQPAVF